MNGMAMWEFGGKGLEGGGTEADIRARSGRPITAGKEGARARGGCRPRGPFGHGSVRSRRLATPVVVGTPLARAGVYPPQTDQVPTPPTKLDQVVRPGPGLCAYVAPAILGFKFHFISGMAM